MQAYCVYAQNSSAEGCLIVLECVNYPYQECFTVLIGLARSNIFHDCNLPCATGSLYGYAYSHGVVADLPSVTLESIRFDQDMTVSTSTAGTSTPSKTRVYNHSLFSITFPISCILFNLSYRKLELTDYNGFVAFTTAYITYFWALIAVLFLLHAGSLYIFLIVVINCISVTLLLCCITLTAVFMIKRSPGRNQSKFEVMVPYISYCINLMFATASSIHVRIKYTHYR